MVDKGYEYPLYSLDLLGPGVEPEEDGRFCLAVPDGRLVVRPALRCRARGLGTGACDRALAVALAHHERALGVLAPCGLDADWADSVRHWAHRMWQEEDARQQVEIELLEQSKRRGAALRHARGLVRRLQICASLAGVPLRPGRAPRGPLAFVDALVTLEDRLREAPLAAALARAGFGPDLRAQLTEARACLRPTRCRSEDLATVRQGCSDRLLVIRAALLGDVARLCRAASGVVPPEQARALRLERLFGRRKERRGAVPAPLAGLTAPPGR